METQHFDPAQGNRSTASYRADSQKAASTAPCDECAVRALAICATLDRDEREQFIRLGRQMSLPKGQALMWEGGDSMLVANVVDGAMMLSTSTSDGREQIVGIIYPSDFIGRPFGSESPYSAVALTDARLCVFSRATFDRFAHAHPGMEHRLLQHTLDELDRTRRWMLLLGRKSARERIATFLLETSRKLAQGKGQDCLPLDHFTLPLDRQQIANVLGLTIETVSRQFSALKRDGIIALPDRRSIEILDRAQLQDMAEADETV